MIKKLILFCFGLSLFLPFTEACAQEGHASCFVYHRFGDLRYPSTNISTDTFRQQLNYLKENDYHVTTIGEVAEVIANEGVIPEKTVILTIDDAYRSFYDNALPLLEEFGYRATLFVNSKTAGGGDYMSWKEIKAAMEKGIEIGNHSHGHQHFLDIKSEEERRTKFIGDLNLSTALFEEHLGFMPDIYSFPYGEYGGVLINALEDKAYRLAAAQYSGVLYSGSDIYAVPRFPMGGPFASLEGFIQKLQMLPMKVNSIRPDGIQLVDNPPHLVLSIEKGSIDITSVQCFVDGEKNCTVQINETAEHIQVEMVSDKKLQRRRTLYTITARSVNDTGWCWFSHVWVNTEVAEE